MSSDCLIIRSRSSEQGFVLVTSIIMLSLLTLLALAMFYTTRSATQTSASAQSSTEAYYYAETAINYISWALANDAEFDSHTGYPGAYDISGFSEPSQPSNASSVGDDTELKSFMWSPGPTTMTGDSGTSVAGQVRYFDNTPMGGRAICFEDDSTFANCIDVLTDPTTRVAPTMYQISASLPRYIRLEIAADGTITPAIPQLPHHSTPVVGQDIPNNGAVVWITAGNPDNTEQDVEIYPFDFSSTLPANCHQTSGGCPCEADGGITSTGSVATNSAIHWETDIPSGNNITINLTHPGTSSSALAVTVSGDTVNVSLATDGSNLVSSTASDVITAVNGTTAATDLFYDPATMSNLITNAAGSDGTGTVDAETVTLVRYENAQSCNANTGEWYQEFGVVAYAIGYVNGEASHLIRAVIR